MSAQSTPPRGGAREAWDAPLPEEDDASAPAFAGASPSARDGGGDGGGGGSLLSASARAPGALACCAPASVVSQQRWARCATFTLGASYALVLATAALSLYALVTRREGLQTWAYAIGLISLFLALPISLYDIHQHISHMVSPLQIRYVRILAMVPLYSIESWLALFFRQQRVGLELARELYEAFVIYNTFALLVDFLGGAAVAQALLRSHGVRGKHIFCLARLGLRGWHTDNGEFYRRCSLCVLQYVVVRVALALLTAALSTAGLYCEGEWRWGSCAYPYFTVALSLSQFAAIYGLFLFRHELSAELEPIRPWPKLVCVKVIVFATFWLGAALHGAQLAGLIQCVFLGGRGGGKGAAHAQCMRAQWLAHNSFFSRSSCRPPPTPLTLLLPPPPHPQAVWGLLLGGRDCWRGQPQRVRHVRRGGPGPPLLLWPGRV